MKAAEQAWTMLRTAGTLFIAVSLCDAGDTAGSVAEALENLHYTQAQAADWEGFQPGSSVTYRRVGKSRIVGAYREVVTQVLTGRTPTTLKFAMVLGNGERNPWLPADIEAKGLVAVNAKKVGEEDVFIGRQKFHAEIYLFMYQRGGKSYEQTYWLAAGAPDGVVRHHEIIEVDPTFTSESDMRLTQLNVELKAGTKTVRGNCFETEEGTRGGKFTRTHMCKSREVPGAVVTAETTEMEGSEEKAHVMQTVENFTVVR